MILNEAGVYSGKSGYMFDQFNETYQAFESAELVNKITGLMLDMVLWCSS